MIRAVPKNSIQSSYACSDALGIWQRPWGKPQGVKGMDTPDADISAVAPEAGTEH